MVKVNFSFVGIAKKNIALSWSWATVDQYLEEIQLPIPNINSEHIFSSSSERDNNSPRYDIILNI